MSKRSSLVLLVAAGAAAALVSVPALVAARADGGTSIASAPELPIGKQVFSGVARVDYWRIAFKAGDQFVVNYGPTDGGSVELCFMRPEVTDYTLQDARCWQPLSTDETYGSKRQTSRIISTPGRWTLVVGDDNCIYDQVSVRCTSPVAYELTGFIRRVTRVLLSAPPRVANARATLSVKGRVTGATRGNVALQVRSGRWRNVTVARVGAGGRFAIKIKPSAPGTYRYRILYPGDNAHRSSAASFVLTRV